MKFELSGAMTYLRYFGFILSVLFVTTLVCQETPAVEAPAARQDYQKAVTDLEALRVEDGKTVVDMAHASQIYTREAPARKSILIIHGLHESPFYMEAFTNYFFDQGYNVFSLLLPGHLRRDAKSIDYVKYAQWINQAERAFESTKALGEETDVLGYSLGGTLAMYLALKHPESVKKLYLIAPALALSSKIVMSGNVLGWTHIDMQGICASQSSPQCSAVTLTDPSLKVMLKDGLAGSPAAGQQIKYLINFMVKTFGPKTPVSGGTYGKLLATYDNIKIPILMVNSKHDGVIDAVFNQKFISAYEGRKESVYYGDDKPVTHIFLNKTPMHTFRNTPEFNPYFSEIFDGISRLQN